MHSTVSRKGQPPVGPFFYSPCMSHADHASTPTHTLTYPTTYHYDPILGKADCPVHLEPVIVQSRPGMTEKHSQRYSQRTMERPNLASPGKHFRENPASFSVCQHCRATKADAQTKMTVLVSGFCSAKCRAKCLTSQWGCISGWAWSFPVGGWDAAAEHIWKWSTHQKEWRKVSILH